MVKLCQEHMDAICHAELFLESATEKVQSRKMLAVLENDKLRLAELKLYILTSMSQPNLLFPEPGNNGEKPDISKSSS